MWAKAVIVCVWMTTACAGGALSSAGDTAPRACGGSSGCEPGDSGGSGEYVVPVLILAAVVTIPAVIHHQFR